MKTFLLTLSLHWVLTQATFLHKKSDNNKWTKSYHKTSNNWSKSDYICSSSKYSDSVKRKYNCKTESFSTSSQSSGKVTLKNSQACYDKNKYCATWATRSECSRNPSWMLSNCPIACEVCDFCEDFNQYCEDWARLGECRTNRKYMNIYCKKSCGVCGSGLTPPTASPTTTTTTTRRPTTTRRTTTKKPQRPSYCKDRNYKCKKWARQGYCHRSKYYYYMKKNCQQSCHYCHRSP